MYKLHIANTFFEWELETEPKCSLDEAMHQHPIFRQLQFLPVLYASENEGALLFDAPQHEYWDALKARSIRFPQPIESALPISAEIESWGPSQLIAKFASQHRLVYAMPDWGIVRQINSKRFSFECSPKLSNSALLNDQADAEHWLKSFEGAKVLKTCYGVSGKGHLIIHQPDFPSERIAAFLKGEWRKGFPVIAEPWVERVLDFSTQWQIQQNQHVSYLGTTLCFNDAQGQYRYNVIGEEEDLFRSHLSFLKEHRTIAEPILLKIARLGFFGNVGIDAMLYTLPYNREDILLHPIVEINARKTMGWAALMFQKKYFPHQRLQFSYSPQTQGLLPQSVHAKNGKKILFQRNLNIEIGSDTVYN